MHLLVLLCTHNLPYSYTHLSTEFPLKRITWIYNTYELNFVIKYDFEKHCNEHCLTCCENLFCLNILQILDTWGTYPKPTGLVSNHGDAWVSTWKNVVNCDSALISYCSLKFNLSICRLRSHHSWKKKVKVINRKCFSHNMKLLNHLEYANFQKKK